MYGGYFEDPFGQGSGLVEDNRPDCRESVHVIGALDEDAFAGGAADTAEEGKGHGDDKGARA